MGGAKSGKTSLISKLVYDISRDTYYPTIRINPVLHNFAPEDTLSRLILDENHSSIKQLNRSNLLLSPVLLETFLKPNKINQQPIVDDINVVSKNESYYLYQYRSENNQPPHVTPILVELIDTPRFNPSEIVPFLEASLYIKLGKEVLHNLADEPRQPTLANPLLVASGASEMNGNIDGYFFVYSSIPSYNPPGYELFGNVPTETLSPKASPDGSSCALPNDVQGESFDLLSIMKHALDEAWQEYNTYKEKWELGKERDIFSIKSALKNLWTENNPASLEKLRKQLRSETKLMVNPTDPSDVNCPPPIWLICTNVDSNLSSPTYVENGTKLAKFWDCGFIAIDSSENNVSLALMIREIVERRKLQANSKAQLNNKAQRGKSKTHQV